MAWIAARRVDAPATRRAGLTPQRPFATVTHVMPRAGKRHQAAMRDVLAGRRRSRVKRVRPGTPPGTLLPSDERAPVVITVMHYTPDGLVENQVKAVEECFPFLDQPGVTWINVDGLGHPEVVARLGERLQFHPLAVEDVFNVPQRPKAEAYADHFLVVLKILQLTPDLEEEQVSVFFGASYVVTVPERPGGDVFESVRERLRGAQGRRGWW